MSKDMPNHHMRYAHIDIDQTALAHNVETLYAQLPATTKLLAMVKADAYGHRVNLVLDGLMGADGFGVATLAEGLEVYRHCHAVGQNKLIVLMEGVFGQSEWQTAIEHGFSVLIHQPKQLAWTLEQTPPDGSPTKTIWLKYNTGMSRLGFDKSGIITASKALYDKGYRLILTSHFACADDREHQHNAEQIVRFDEMLTHLKTTLSSDVQGSLCNSAGVVNFAHTHYDWVRAGIALYGTSPVIDQTHQQLNLKPVMHFYAQIMAVHTLQAGQSVGYGLLWTASKPSQIGVVSVGYGDGYPRVVHNAWLSLLKNDKQYHVPIVGRVAMDMLMVDLSDVPEADIGDTVVLWGASPSVAEVAEFAGTISYELLCKTTQRPSRAIRE